MAIFKKSKKKKYMFDEYSDVFSSLDEEYMNSDISVDKTDPFKLASDSNDDLKPSKPSTKSDSKLSKDLILFEELKEGDDCIKYCDLIKSGKPVVLNFEHLDIDEANKAISFLSGTVYTLDGKVLQIQEKIYLFAKKEELQDGSLFEFVEGLK